VPKRIFQRAIEDVNADFEKTLDGIPVPPHLLPRRHAFGDDLVNSRFSKAVSGVNNKSALATLIIPYFSQFFLSSITGDDYRQ